MTRRAAATALALLLLSGVVAASIATETYTVNDAGPGVAGGINESGSIAGSTTAADGSSRAFLWTPATQQQTDLGMAYSYAADVNDDGVVVGTAASGGTWQAFHWANGVTTELGTLSGFVWSEARAVNASGQIAGRCTDNQGYESRPF